MEIFTRCIIKTLEKAKDDGEISEGDPQQLGKTMIAAIMGSAVQWDVNPTEVSTARVLKVIDELLRQYLVEESWKADPN